MRLLFCLLCLAFTCTTKAQNQQVADSLQQLLKVAKEDTNKVMLLLRTGRAYRDIDLKTAHDFINEAGHLSSKLNFQKGQFTTLLQKAGLFRAEGNNDSVFAYNKLFLDLAEQKKDSVNMGIGYLNMAESYSDFSDQEATIEHALKGLPIIENSNRDDLKDDAYALLLRVYLDRTEYEKALQYGEKALLIARKMKSTQREALTLFNMALVYSKQKNYPKAIETTDHFIVLSKANENERFEAYGYGNLSDIYLRIQDVPKAKQNATQSLLLARKTGDRSMEANALRGLAMGLLQEKNYSNALMYTDSSLAIQTELNDVESQQQCIRLKADILYAMGNPSAAARYAFDTEEYQATYIKQILSKQSAELEKKYETDKKEAQIQLQQVTIAQQNTMNTVLIGSAIGLTIILLLVYRNYRTRQQLQQQRINELETQQQLTATEAILKGEEQERSRLAKDLHDGLGGMLSGVKLQLGAMKGNLILTEEHGRVFNQAIQKLDESISEMRRVAHNMMPEALLKLGLQAALEDYCDGLSSGQSFQINTAFYGLEKRINPSDEVVVYRIVQELVNNAVKHAEATTILVQVMKQEDRLTITVEDNGKGFDKEMLSRFTSSGLTNIQSRVNYLRGTMDIKTEPGKGSSIHIDCLIQPYE